MKGRPQAPALDALRDELRRGKRTTTSVDAQWRAANAEMWALDMADYPSIAESFHRCSISRGHAAGLAQESGFSHSVERSLRRPRGQSCRLICTSTILRHRRATTWLAQGKNPVQVKEALGHADLRTTMEYTHLVKEHLRSLVSEASQRSVSASTEVGT